MSKREKKSDKKKLEVKRETLRKMEISPADLAQVNGGLYSHDPPGTYPSGSRVC